MKFVGHALLRMFAIGLATWIIPGVTTTGIWPLFWLMVVLVPIDFIIKPIIHILSLPISIVTLGLFALVINGLMVILASALVPGFFIDGLWAGIIFSITLSLVSAVLEKLFIKNY